MQILAAQEMGYLADIKRDNNGRQNTRHAANFSCIKALTPHVKKARKNDLIRC